MAYQYASWVVAVLSLALRLHFPSAGREAFLLHTHLADMTEVVRGDLFDADVEALVNPVHCAGLMKRGLCRQFKTRFPENFDRYESACDADALAPGDVLVHDQGGLFGDAQRPRYILNVATKDHWRDASRPANIRAGMAAVVNEVQARSISSLAVPALGCGGGGLDWPTVRPLLTDPLRLLDDVRVLVYAPRSADVGTADESGATVPEMTRGRALLLTTLDAYASPDDTLSPHAAHNLAYLLQGTGEALHLQFEPGQYGLRAPGLTAVLRHIDGHFIEGVDPDHQDAPIRLRPDALEEADRTVREAPGAATRRRRVEQLIEDIDTPDGLELLATVGWIVRHNPQARRRPEAAVRAVQDWSRRKAERFASEHIGAMWTRLRRHGWGDEAPSDTGS